MRIVLAGTSHWHAGMHMDAALEAGADVAGIWDEDVSNAREFEASTGSRALSSLEDVMASKPDVILLMGRPDQVPERALAIIEGGIPLILEKPGASSTAQLLPMQQAASQRNAFVSVPLPNRFGPAVAKFEQLRAEDRAGRLAHAHFRVVNGPPERYAVDGVPWVVNPQIAGGGALRNLGIHGVDAALNLAIGKLSIRSASIGNRIHRSPVEDYALLVLEDEAGAVFTVEAGYTFASMRAGGDFEWRIVSANATLIDHGDRASCATLDDGVVLDLPPEPTATRYRLCMRDTLDRLARGAPPAISLDDYVAAMSLIDMAYEKARQ